MAEETEASRETQKSLDDVASATTQLSHEVRAYAGITKSYNSYRYRFLSGLVFGAGTALGASVLAAILILVAVRFFSAIGANEIVNVIERQAISEDESKN